MSEFGPDQREHVRYLVSEIFTDCRIFQAKYELTGSIDINIGGSCWLITYDPGHEYRQEELELFRDYEALENPVYYRLDACDGEVVKNERIRRSLRNGEAILKPKHEVPVTDPVEIGLLHSIVAAAHSIDKS